MKTIHDPRYRSVIEQLKKRRVALGMNQSTVAAQLGHTNKWQSQIERMDVRIDVCQFVDLCRVLKLDASRLIRRLAEEPSDEDDSSFTYRMAAFHSGVLRAAA